MHVLAYLVTHRELMHRLCRNRWQSTRSVAVKLLEESFCNPVEDAVFIGAKGLFICCAQEIEDQGHSVVAILVETHARP